ncbi:MAG: tetratricopeptide repeat protein, partial [Spirochaetales bacterium]
LLSAGNVEQARSTAAAELEAAPDNLSALFVLSEIERFSGDSVAQRAALDKLLARDPANADGQAAMGNLLFDDKNYRAAKSAFNQALSSNPVHAEALLGLGQVQFRMDDMNGALATLDKALATYPSDPLVRLDRSRVLYQLGRYGECESELDEAVRLAPDSSWSYLERGRLYLDTGRTEAALADFSSSIELNPDYFLPYVYRAGILEEAGEVERALADYRRITKLYPDYWYAFESIGALSYRMGAWRAAWEAFDKAASHSDAHPEYLIAAGLSLMRDGDAKAAKDYAAKKLSRIDKEKYPSQWLMLRLVYDQTDMSSELEIRISSEKSRDLKAGILFYLGSYWIARGKPELGSKYLKLSADEGRTGVIEFHMAEADLKRLAARQ